MPPRTFACRQLTCSPLLAPTECAHWHPSTGELGPHMPRVNREERKLPRGSSQPPHLTLLPRHLPPSLPLVVRTPALAGALELSRQLLTSKQPGGSIRSASFPLALSSIAPAGRPAGHCEAPVSKQASRVHVAYDDKPLCQQLAVAGSARGRRGVLTRPVRLHCNENTEELVGPASR